MQRLPEEVTRGPQILLSQALNPCSEPVSTGPVRQHLMYTAFLKAQAGSTRGLTNSCRLTHTQVAAEGPHGSLGWHSSPLHACVPSVHCPTPSCTCALSWCTAHTQLGCSLMGDWKEDPSGYGDSDHTSFTRWQVLVIGTLSPQVRVPLVNGHLANLPGSKAVSLLSIIQEFWQMFGPHACTNAGVGQAVPSTCAGRRSAEPGGCVCSFNNS